ncbi:MAG: UPF0158 family protein [Acholeplasmatales bacterium]|jgi:hypothetical protein|nr:UPF0158 family protein [Acholeplasmataceae bacterium]MCK9234561.1 UPF0158 family protein [Acholeplasmataceae bacterium]MCK9289762.1 UPF0158 family protein [Acholeplasmataceae bacterium]MCK9428067.1 UPF0158 family protein [Acholeplasmataceae bacterium]MDY0115356.1 UPF0158 family protein [Acholeplasmatales bacterium]
MLKIKIEKIVEAFNVITNDYSAYFNKETYQIVFLSDEYQMIASDDYDLTKFNDWEKEEINRAEEVLYTDKYLSLPLKYDLHEYQIMKNFCLTLPDFLINIFRDALSKKGAFSNFKFLINKHHLTEKWYQYKHNEFIRIAIEWCQSNGIIYTK